MNFQTTLFRTTLFRTTRGFVLVCSVALVATSLPAGAKPWQAHPGGREVAAKRHHASHSRTHHRRHVDRQRLRQRDRTVQSQNDPAYIPGVQDRHDRYPDALADRPYLRASAPSSRRSRQVHRAARAVFASTGPAVAPGRMANAGGLFGSSSVVAEARRHIGTNPTGRSRLWCARFMNMVLERAGHRSTGSDMARSFASYGQRLSGPQVGAIAVMSRGRRGGHVGVVSGIDPKGNPIIISGNHNRRVAEATYPRGRIYAYVMPN